MRFPGQRNPKHYFPVTRKQKRVDPALEAEHPGWYLVGLDQVLVDMEVRAPLRFIVEAGLTPGESNRLGEARFRELLARIEGAGLRFRYAPGGTVANSLCNYTFLSGEPAYLLGTIEDCIRPHGPAWSYVAQTPRALSLEHLTPVPGSVGTAITLICENGDRTFAVAPGVSTLYGPEHLPVDVLQKAAAVVATLYTLEDASWPIARATLRLMERATAARVPVAFGLGTAGLVERLGPQVVDLLREYVTIAAMNDREARALTGLHDALLSCEAALEWVDVVIVTEGIEGMTIGGYTDERLKRATDREPQDGSIPEYNRWEFSRLMRREDCETPVKIYTHIHPYQGGPERLANTSGAGDAALAAVLHDMTANAYHRAVLPESPKHSHAVPFLSYSSLSRIAQYGNRVAYEVLCGYSPRLDGPVPSDLPFKTDEPESEPGE